MRTRTRLAATAAVVAAVLVAAGCGTKASSSTPATPTPSPSPPAAQGSLGAVVGLAGYLAHLRPVATRIETTVTALPDAVRGLSTKPDASWTRSATRLETASSQLGAEAAQLASLTPPQSLRMVQDAAEQGLKGAQSAVAGTAAVLNKGAAGGASSAQIQSQIEAVKGHLTALGQRLFAAAEKAIFSSGSSPAS